MKRGLLVLTIALLAACSSNPEPAPVPPASPPASSAGPSAPAVTGALATDLAAPWSVVPLAADRALISQRDSGEVLLLADGTTSVAGRIDQVLPGGEGGLLGLAMVSPDADQVFAYYTAATDNRVVVFDFDGRRLSNERTVLGGIPKGFIHNGGRIAFGPDGYLYIATGEIGEPALAQDRSSLAGKILRVTPKGTPVPSNPDPRSPVWSWGHRNIQGLAWDSAGRLWATEFGQDDVDELNLIEAGKNYGWPQCEGPCDEPGTTNPKATWSPTSTSSPSGLAIVDDVAWVAGLRGEALFEIQLDGVRAREPFPWFSGDHGRLRDVVAAPDGGLWVLTNNTDGRGDPGPDDDQLLAVELPALPQLQS
ncbi:MAG: PQQ-dependent sugar dehydrogenase [Candidatus Nanopelagicales bacterium]